MNPIMPRRAAANEQACRSCSAGSIATGGSNAIALQRTIAPRPPIASSPVGESRFGNRPENANNATSAATPSPQSIPITVPSRPAARHCSVEKP